MKNWDVAFASRATASRTTPMIPPELIHASPQTVPRNRRYAAPDGGIVIASCDTEHVSNDHQQYPHPHSHEYHQQQQAVARYLVPPASFGAPAVEQGCSPTGKIPNDGVGYGGAECKSHVCIRMFLPKTFPVPTRRGEPSKVLELRSWRELPENPLNGLPGLMVEPATVRREDCRFYCDPCQKGFLTQERYEKHMTEHIWCKVPGCNFTCRSGKEWKMEMHMETLHNRPDAPNLADVGTYLAQRRGRFPTQETVKAKMEELFYKASRGVVLPDERRRWLRQHGVFVKKHPRTEESYIASDALRDMSRATRARSGEQKKSPLPPPPPPLQQQHEKQQQHHQRKEEENQHDGDGEDSNKILVRADENKDGNQTLEDGKSAVSQEFLRYGRPKRIFPLGPNGTLTRAQKVQLVREKYYEARTVPRFYVCNRCGEKGAHWVGECPTKGEKAFERQIVWGEERREPPLRKYRTETGVEAKEEGTAMSSKASSPVGSDGRVSEEDLVASVGVADSVPCDVPGADAACTTEETLEILDDDFPPAELSARNPEGGESAKEEVTRMLAPVAAAAAVTHSEGRRRVEQHQQRRGARQRPRPPTLFERMVESDEANERSLLLQAFRFFVMRRFFCPL